MTAGKLIEELQKHPEWMQVHIDTDNVMISVSGTDYTKYQEIGIVERVPWRHDDRIAITVKEDE